MNLNLKKMKCKHVCYYCNIFTKISEYGSTKDEIRNYNNKEEDTENLKHFWREDKWKQVQKASTLKIFVN